MKFLFCGIALVIQPFFFYVVYRKQEKEEAALKMPMVYFSVFYLVAQMYVFVKYCLRLQGEYEKYSYLIQSVILILYVLAESALLFGNKYIKRVDKEEKDRISDFKDLVREVELQIVQTKDETMKASLQKVYEAMRYEDPVTNQNAAGETQKIKELLAHISEINDLELMDKRCKEIQKLIEMRRIKNTRR